MMKKRNWLQRFKWLLIIGVFCISCQAELSEDEKFDRFAQQYEKMVERVFPATAQNLSVDSLVAKDLTKTEILHKVEFCQENLDRLANFELEKISPANTEKLKQIFGEVKAHLKEMEKAAMGNGQ